MKKLQRLFILALGLVSLGQLQAQHRSCITFERWQAQAQRDPSMIERRQLSETATQNWIATHPNADDIQAVITIPVVVHVVYNGAGQNISDSQIHSNIATLNEDYRLLNADSVPSGHPFWVHTADAQIEFCLASTDPSGNTTTGITRTSTSHGVFQNANIDDIKFTSSGGRDNWDPTHYLNIWICDLGNQLYGYATFPSDLAVDPAYDGVVINYTAFGSEGTASAPSDLGRTATHEIGHWLNLNHIWGDQICGDDLVADTEPAEDANYGCFAFPHNPNNSCGGGANGEMYMNYMDYVDDNCMNMFTFGQKSRMRAALSTDRSAILTSTGCGNTAAVRDVQGKSSITAFPNPSTGILTLSAQNLSPKQASVTVLNTLGVEVLRHEAVKSFPHDLDLSALPADLYFVKVSSGSSVLTQKVIITH